GTIFENVWRFAARSGELRDARHVEPADAHDYRSAVAGESQQDFPGHRTVHGGRRCAGHSVWGRADIREDFFPRQDFRPSRTDGRASAWALQQENQLARFLLIT